MLPIIWRFSYFLVSNIVFQSSRIFITIQVLLKESSPQCRQVIPVLICTTLEIFLSGKSKCQLQRAKALSFSSNGLQPVSRFVPQCDDDGSYSKIQCWASTGYCWCADENGTELEGTRVRGKPTCPSGRSSMY